MANTYLSNLDFIPQTFKDYVDGEVAKRSNFINSEAVRFDDTVIPVYGNTVTLPSWDGLAGADDVKSATAPATNNLTTSAQVAPILERVKKYGSNDLVASFTSADPFGDLGNKFGAYWAQRVDEVLVASAMGSAKGIDALSAGTIINNISGASGAAAVITAGAVIDTQSLGGEHADAYKVMVVHSQVLGLLRKLNLVAFEPNSTGTAMFAYYGDMRLVVSDTAGVSAGGGIYNTLLVAPSAFSYADGTNPLHVLEQDREIGFADLVASSKRYVMHPRGAKWTGTPAGSTASNAELATAGNWTLGLDSSQLYGVRVLTHKIA